MVLYRWSMRISRPQTIAVSPALVIALVISLSLIGNNGCQYVFACQCVRLPPEKNAERSDVIFLGKVINVAREMPLEKGSHVTFAVSKAWKGVDTTTVTIHTGDGSSCGSYPFSAQDFYQEHLVYGTRDFSEIRVSLCGGTIPTFPNEPSLNVSRDLGYLDKNFEPIELKVGHIRSADIFPSLQILGGLVTVAIAAFLVIRRG